MKQSDQQKTHVSRSMSQHLLTEQDIKKIFPYTQSIHNRYLEQNRMESIRDQLNNQQQQSISIHIKDLIVKDKLKPRLLQPLTMLDESCNRGVRRMKKLLYHDSQNVNLHNINQRREMVQLAQWLDMMVEQVHSQKLTDYQEYYNKLEIVFQGSVLELERQISIVGFEFGQFLKKLWEAFTEEVQKIILGLQQRNEQIEQKCLEDINQLHKNYQDAIEKQAESMRMMKEEALAVQNSIIKMKKENVYLRKKDKRREEQLHDIMSDFWEQSLQLIEYQGIDKFHKQAETAEEMDLVLQQKDMFEFFKQKFEVHKKEIENQYKILTLQDEYYDGSTHLIITESSVDTSDLIKTKVQSEDTSEYFVYVSSSTQTPKQAKKIDEEIQVQPSQGNQESQVNSTQLRKERVPRNQTESKLFRRARFPLSEIIQEYSSLYFPEQELSSNDPQFIVIMADQITQLKDRIEDLLTVLNLRGDNSSEDIQAIKQYLLQNYGNFNYYFNQCWNVLQTQISVVMDAKIDKEEMELEMKEIENKFNENVALFKKYHNRTKEKETISKFYEDSLIKVIRYAPQFLINQIKEQANAYGVLENVEFKEFKRRQGTNIDPKQSQQLSNKDLDSPTRSPNKTLTNINISKPLMKIQKIPSQIEISSKEDDDIYKSDSSKEGSGNESDVSFSQIKLDFKQSKPKLTIEKKLRISTCPVKSASYATNLLKQMISKFNINQRTGLYQLSTILQNYNELIMKIPNTIQNTPLHVHMYENIVAHYGQSQFSDANRYKRTIRSFLFFETKSSTCQLVVKFLKAEYDIQDLNLYLQIVQSLQEYPNVSYSKFIDTLLKWFFDNKYSQNEIDNIIYDISTSEVAYMQSQQGPCDYDILMFQFLEIFQKYKNRTSVKYKHLYTAVDLVNKGSIDFYQWNFLYEVLCCINYSFSIRLFYQEADYCGDSGKMMSKQRFTLVCDELKIFQEDDQIKLLDRETYFTIREKINTQWMREKIVMKMSFIKANKYNKFIKSIFAAIDSFVQNPKNCQFEAETICYMYKLLQKTWKPSFLESQLNIGIPVEISLINSTYRKLELQILNKD
ncbi:unnamed protein product [Paramecium primaurelia]|uniref:Uncharacterized protein n=1 Tax=Paramecium primaurelia TaxID=5886 RepID=A0A8S1LU00_PARPR|nr:unnamed protein product [Paramecium primaurelia]